MSLKASTKKVLSGQALTPDEALQLYQEAELTTLGMLADRCRRRIREEKGLPLDTVSYIIDRNINPTNVCITDCGFCAFYRRPGKEDAYVLSRDEIYRKIDELIAAGGVQVLLQGGHHPKLNTAWFADLFRDIKQRYPDLWIHAMSPPEISHLSRLDRKPIFEVIGELIEAGLDSIPGGGAEILVERVRKIIAPKKATTDEWLDVMRQLARHGKRGTATMMFGHVETMAERIEHLERVRQLQEECGVFTAFIPWTFQPAHTPKGSEWLPENNKASSAEYLRMLAMSRIYLHNIDHIQSSWVTQGIKICQVGLSMGADDFGSAMLEENVVSSAGCDNMTSVLEIERHITNAGFVPQRRNMLYQYLSDTDQPVLSNKGATA
ncbi:MAG: dehypoxanthine futalosine cyclase [Planctomycetota bacterium]|nr:MAG: dehypoxanthine futalosine cyclase [Planctomycetota bacterium]